MDNEFRGKMRVSNTSTTEATVYTLPCSIFCNISKFAWAHTCTYIMHINIYMHTDTNTQVLNMFVILWHTWHICQILLFFYFKSIQKFEVLIDIEVKSANLEWSRFFSLSTRATLLNCFECHPITSQNRRRFCALDFGFDCMKFR